MISLTTFFCAIYKNVKVVAAWRVTWVRRWKRTNSRFWRKALRKSGPYLSPEGIGTIDKQGPYLFDEDGEYSTTTINGKECVFAVYDDAGILRCGIENAYAEGKVSFRKPISCHLYPIRITKYDDFYAINYDRWEICRPACELGKAKQVPLYKFLGEALKRKFGEEWYKLLCNNIESS
jgi:hypothetical protein